MDPEPMTEKNSSFRQDRRHWLKMSASAVGAAFVPLPATGGQTNPASSAVPSQEAPSGARFFTPAQHREIEELAETIIPADSRSGGAKAAGVADYIEQIIGETLEEEEKTLWKEGLRLVDLMSQHHSGKSFADSSPEDKIYVLTILSDNDEMTDLPEIRFFRDLKKLTVRGYYTSRIGIHDELQYKGNKLLLNYVGCEDVKSS